MHEAAPICVLHGVNLKKLTCTLLCIVAWCSPTWPPRPVFPSIPLILAGGCRRPSQVPRAAIHAPQAPPLPPHALYPRPILSRTFTLKVPRTWSSHVRLVASLLTCPPQRSLPTLREPVSPSIPSLPSVLPGGCRRPLASPSGYACAAGATPPRPILTRSLQHGT